MLCVLICFGSTSCTNLDEELFGRLSTDNFYQNEDEVLSVLAGVYSSMGFAGDGGNGWRTVHLGTDEFVIPSRSDGRWFDGGVWLEFTKHNWTAQNNRLLSGWSSIFTTIGRANSVIASLEESGQAFPQQIAEMRAVRAYAYLYALDSWGNVPIVTADRIDPNNLPKTSPRTEVFDFIVSELLAAIDGLPSINDVNRSEYYGRMTKEAAYAILTIVYLNGEVYTGRTYWNEALRAADEVIASGGYALAADYFDNFKSDNETSPELIYVITIDPANNAGGNSFVLRGTHDSHRFTYNLPFTPQNGFTTTAIAYDRYEDIDARKGMFLIGPQYDASGSPLKTISGTSDLVIIPHQNIDNSAENEGHRLVKWTPEGPWVGSAGVNDIPLIRYADVLLMKAEALLRSGGSVADALALVNAVRTRSHATAWQTLTLQDILDERGRELIWEGVRRRDMIRFGTYLTWTWPFKPNASPAHRLLFPIPATELEANPNLEQNEGY